MSTDSCPPPRPYDEPVEPVGPVGWQTAAACAGLPPKAVFSKKVKEAAPVLRACARCPVRRDCERIVAPADNWFDGVCGGRLYRSGRAVEIPAHLMPAASAASAAPAAWTDLTAPAAPTPLTARSARPALPTARAPRGGSLA
ncbi:WhiB family transcriptional regulator [Streptomyces sp. NPDC051665]|uniref:WhiB family transcriptional regulator n=1 Tax=Streptomyces sp. NPDC051665 TaxID=3154647 RepID=UPI0034208017